ncbi:hypothetical protein CLAVI_000789 [Candidatus Clavichlamydia salmonicola]|uniref:hypothetical protein n=1 Tax=Candidatus Clavichlamydia salmonicola TaxID=469812 RepID=UPI00189180DA|nr:hypothetical protein [Candidatus Clavichlamydia salmonicola]MBF5051153.1 hypothetical protein [Candidatus Clavichlamydia salmonicola]
MASITMGQIIDNQNTSSDIELSLEQQLEIKKEQKFLLQEELNKLKESVQQQKNLPYNFLESKKIKFLNQEQLSKLHKYR